MHPQSLAACTQLSDAQPPCAKSPQLEEAHTLSPQLEEAQTISGCTIAPAVAACTHFICTAALCRVATAGRRTHYRHRWKKHRLFQAVQLHPQSLAACTHFICTAALCKVATAGKTTHYRHSWKKHRLFQAVQLHLQSLAACTHFICTAALCRVATAANSTDYFKLYNCTRSHWLRARTSYAQPPCAELPQLEKHRLLQAVQMHPQSQAPCTHIICTAALRRVSTAGNSTDYFKLYKCTSSHRLHAHTLYAQPPCAKSPQLEKAQITASCTIAPAVTGCVHALHMHSRLVQSRHSWKKHGLTQAVQMHPPSQALCTHIICTAALRRVSTAANSIDYCKLCEGTSSHRLHAHTYLHSSLRRVATAGRSTSKCRLYRQALAPCTYLKCTAALRSVATAGGAPCLLPA